MKLVLFLPSLDLGGAERSFVRLANGLTRRGHDVELVTAIAGGPLEAAVAPGVRRIQLDAERVTRGPVLALRSLFRLRHHLAQSRPDAMLSTVTGANLVSLLAHMLGANIPWLVIREAVTLENVRSPFRLAAMRLTYRRANRLVSLTTTMKAQLVNKLGLGATAIDVIENVVDPAELRTLAADSRPASRVESLRPFAVMVGRLVTQKSPATALRAWARLHTRSALNLVIVGDGPLRGDLERLADSLSISERVHFLGIQPNPYPWIAAAEQLILCSAWEGHPNVLLEADALGVPSIVTRYDASVPQMRAAGINIRIVDVDDDEAIARHLIAGPGSPCPPSKTAHLDRFEQWLDAYERVLTRSGT